MLLAAPLGWAIEHTMTDRKLPKTALVWSQFTPHHVDRCAATARRLDGQAQVVAIEVASTSSAYADFAPAEDAGEVQRHTLFPGRSFDRIPRWRRFLAVLRCVANCRTVCFGVPYSHLDFLLLAWVLRLLGKQVILLSVSKFDDFPRSALFEYLKAIGLSCFDAVVVPGDRGREFFRYLGFRRRPVVMGDNTISISRIIAQAAENGIVPEVSFEAREFIFVGRFIEKKNLLLLLEGYARYCRAEGDQARRLVLVGTGPLEEALRIEAAEKVPEGKAIFTGFLAGSELYSRLAGSLGLVLVSISEQWGLVVNEAMALGLPVITSEAPGARDVLVRNLVNGFVLENGSAEGIALAMQRLGADQKAWQRMSDASRERAPLGDVAVFAEAIAVLMGFGIEDGNRKPEIDE